MLVTTATSAVQDYDDDYAAARAANPPAGTEDVTSSPLPAAREPGTPFEQTTPTAAPDGHRYDQWGVRLYDDSDSPDDVAYPATLIEGELANAVSWVDMQLRIAACMREQGHDYTFKVWWERSPEDRGGEPLAEDSDAWRLSMARTSPPPDPTTGPRPGATAGSCTRRATMTRTERSTAPSHATDEAGDEGVGSAPALTDPARARRARSLGRSSLALLLAVIVLALFGPFAGSFGLGMRWGEALGWGTVVLGSWIPTFFQLEWILLACGTGALVASAALAADAPPPARPRGVLSSLTILLSSVALTLVLLVALVSSLLFNGSAYSVLPGSSENGCRVAVREHAFLTSAGGDIGVVEPGRFSVDWRASYSSDDGYLPFSAGGYSLHWQGDTAVLRLGDRPASSTGGVRNAELIAREAPLTCG
ncbi:hypothetical protein B0T42_07905 [Rathayibacter sp. VKM Ac-2630]|nr:hypothetical protein B0T42_07905 [Rathayibacter sp. VKM Ac-2630]